MVFSKEQAYSMRFQACPVFQQCGSYMSAENACEIGVAHMQVFRKAADREILRKNAVPIWLPGHP